METLRGLSGWAQGRLEQALGKKLLQILTTDSDSEHSIRLQPRRGSLELENFSLNLKHLNELLANDMYEIKRILIAKLKVIPFSLRVVVEGVEVVVKQRQGMHNEHPSSHSGRENTGFNASQLLFNESEAPEIAESGVSEGISLLSSILRSILKKLHVEVRDIVIRIELANNQRLTINLDSLAVKDAQDAEIELNTPFDLAKVCSFSGLAVKLADDVANEVLSSLSWGTTGCGATIAVGWAVDDFKELTIELKAALDGMCLWMSPAAMPVILNLVEACSSSMRGHQGASDHTNMADHTLSRSMMAADDAFSNNISKALRLPDGEPLLREELAQTGEDIDEFFDAQSSELLDYMAQSFFSTASAVFSESSSRPSSPTGESFAPTEERSRQSAGNEVPPPKVVLQVEMQVAAVELHGLLRTVTIKSIDVSEYTPIEANKSKLHDIEQFEAMYKTFMEHCGLRYPMPLSAEKTVFADTLRRLEHLKLADRNFWCPPDNYEMSPIFACATADHPALSLILEKARALPLSARVLLLEVQSWFNAPMIARIGELLSAFAASFPSRTSEVQPLAALDLTVQLSSLSLCCFATNAAIAIRVVSGESIDEMSSDFFQERRPRRKHTICLPFVDFQQKLGEASCLVSADRVQIYSIEDIDGSIEIVDGGYADALSISCMLNACVDLQALSEDLPNNIAALIDRSRLLPFVDDNLGPTIPGAVTKIRASDITIDGDIQVSVSPTLMRSVTEIVRSFSVYSRPTTNSGAFKVHVVNVSVKFVSPLLLNCSDIDLLHILDDDKSSLVIGLLGSVCLNGSSEWPYISTSNKESRALVFAISDSCARQTTDKKQLFLHLAGIILAENFLREKPVWLEFDNIKNIVMSASSEAAVQAPAVCVSGKELLILHIPSSEHLPTAAAHVQDFSVATAKPLDVLATIHGSSIYLRESRLAYKSIICPFSAQTWVQEKGFLLIAREELVEIKRWSSTVSSVPSESISLHTSSLHINVTKDAASLIKKLGKLPVRRNAPNEEACETVSEMATAAIGEALELDIRGPKEDALLNGGWYEHEGLGVEDTDLRQNSVPTKEATIDGHGSWLYPYPYIYRPDWVRKPTESDTRSIAPARILTIAMETVTLAVIGTASARGGDVLDGSLQLKVGNIKASLRLYDSIDIVHDCTCSLQRLSLQHNIHPQAMLRSSWHDVFICPALRSQSNAFKCRVKMFKSHSELLPPSQFIFPDSLLFSVVSVGGCNEMVLSCEPGSALIRMDQYLLIFLLSFAQEIKEVMHPIDSDWQNVGEGILQQEAGERSEEIKMPAQSEALNFYIRRCHIAGFALTASYTPVYLDMDALREGSYVELVNTLRKWKAFNIWLQDLEICGVESFTSLCADAAARWKQEILDFQLYKFSISLPLGASVPIGTIGKKMTDFAFQPGTPSKETLEQLQKDILALWPKVAGEGRRVGATVAKAWENRR